MRFVKKMRYDAGYSGRPKSTHTDVKEMSCKNYGSRKLKGKSCHGTSFRGHSVTSPMARDLSSHNWYLFIQLKNSHD